MTFHCSPASPGCFTAHSPTQAIAAWLFRQKRMLTCISPHQAEGFGRGLVVALGEARWKAALSTRDGRLETAASSLPVRLARLATAA